MKKWHIEKKTKGLCMYSITRIAEENALSPSESTAWPVSLAKTESSPCSKGSRPGCHSLQHSTIPAKESITSIILKAPSTSLHTNTVCALLPCMPVTKLDGHYWQQQRPASSHWLLPAYPMETPGNRQNKYRKYVEWDTFWWLIMIMWVLLC